MLDSLKNLLWICSGLVLVKVIFGIMEEGKHVVFFAFVDIKNSTEKKSPNVFQANELTASMRVIGKLFCLLAIFATIQYTQSNS